MIRVGIAGAPGMLRSGVETLVRADPEMQLVFTVVSLEEAPTGADVVVAVDSDLDAVSAPQLPAVIAIAPTSPAFVRAALRAGARSVLPPDCTTLELSAALQAAAAGLTALRTTDAEALVAMSAEGPRLPVSTEGVLTPRETEVLRLLADGLANKEIGFKLGISDHTVKFHVNSILTRLNASSRAEAVAIGIRRGLILL
jgi:DNA-binding NarL/FixJ family response regulator